MKQVIRPIYRLTHDLLFATSAVNPFFKQHHHHKKVIKGFIGDEHLLNPDLDKKLLTELQQAGIKTAKHKINILAYHEYLKKASYPKSYYGGGFEPENNFIEKTLEHYVTTEFINFKPETVFLDVAACTSPFYKIVRNVFGVKISCQQDLIFKKGLNGDKIGGYAHESGLPDNSIDAITLHCSLEHFEGKSDTLFFAEINRILRSGGKAVILPFYFAHTYTIHIDPAFNLLRNHHPEIDTEADLRYCNWYQFHSRHYDVKHLQSRIISQLKNCDVTLHLVENFREADEHCYLRWVLEVTKR